MLARELHICDAFVELAPDDLLQVERIFVVVNGHGVLQEAQFEVRLQCPVAEFPVLVASELEIESAERYEYGT